MTLITDKNVLIAANSKVQNIGIENPAEAGVFKNINKLPTKINHALFILLFLVFHLPNQCF